MGEITIRLKYNVQTGKKDIFIGYESEEDMTGYEHESRHREIVQQLLGKGVLDPDEMGETVVERARPGRQGAGNLPQQGSPAPTPDNKEVQKN